jgi:hypothetical protein
MLYSARSSCSNVVPTQNDHCDCAEPCHSVPSPLVGEGQGEGYNRHRACLEKGGPIQSLAEFESKPETNIAHATLSPPLSLSLPHCLGRRQG